MWHALKGTGYSLDIDHTKMDEIENLLNEGLSEYDFNPVTTTADARVVGFPMPGGAIGPNVHMMKEAGILDRYSEVLAVLGYFGRPPLPSDPEVVKIAAEQLGKEPFDGDPLEVAPDSIEEAEAALKERGLELTDENVFLVAAACKPGKNIELNEGLRLLTGKARIVLPLKKKPAEKEAAAAADEAMKAKHDVKAPAAGKVVSIDAGLGDDVMAGMPILTIGS